MPLPGGGKQLVEGKDDHNRDGDVQDDRFKQCKDGEEDHQTEQGRYDALLHRIPPNRRSRRRYSSMAASRSAGVKSGQRMFIKTNSA